MHNPFIKCACEAECSIEKALNIIGGKWSFLIIKNLFGGTMRFGEIRKSLHDISPKTLTVRLRELEENGIVIRTVHPTIPPAVEYTLTDKGWDLIKMIEEMKAWGKKWT